MPETNTALADGEESDVLHFSGGSHEDFVFAKGEKYFFGADIHDFSVCMWFKTSSHRDMTLVSWSAGNSDNAFSLMNPSHLSFTIGQSSSPKPEERMDLTDNLWHHVCVTYENGKGTGKLWVDGIIKAVETDMEPGWEIERGGRLVIGQEQECHEDPLNEGIDEYYVCKYVDYPYQGYQSEVYVWDRPLYDSEIISTYQHSPPANASITYDNILDSLYGNIEAVSAQSVGFPSL